MNDRIKLVKAFPSDAPGIKNLVNEHAARSWLIQLPLSKVYENIRNFYVLKKDGEVAGCAALRVYWDDLAEIRSLVVDDEFRGRNWGRRLVEACLEEAASLGLKKVFTLTVAPEFFRKLGFIPVEKEELPQKIWQDCIYCPHFPDCKETALLREVEKK